MRFLGDLSGDQFSGDKGLKIILLKFPISHQLITDLLHHVDKSTFTKAFCPFMTSDFWWIREQYEDKKNWRMKAKDIAIERLNVCQRMTESVASLRWTCTKARSINVVVFNLDCTLGLRRCDRWRHSLILQGLHGYLVHDSSAASLFRHSVRLFPNG